MANRKGYERRLAVLPGWTLKAIALVVAGAAVMMVALTIARAVSVKPDSAEGGKFVGIRHDAVSVPESTDISPGVSTPAFDAGEESSPKSVVRNGITVLSPPLLVPVIDIA